MALHQLVETIAEMLFLSGFHSPHYASVNRGGQSYIHLRIDNYSIAYRMLAMNALTPTEMLTEIKSLTKLGEIAIAAHIGCSQPTVNRILNGKSDCKGSLVMAIQRWYGELKSQAESADEAV
jgi:hypothetical protein